MMQTAITPEYSARYAKFMAELAIGQEALRRAARVVDRVLPHLPNASGYYQPAAFAAGSRRCAERVALHKAIYPRIRAKVASAADFHAGAAEYAVMCRDERRAA